MSQYLAILKVIRTRDIVRSKISTLHIIPGGEGEAAQVWSEHCEQVRHQGVEPAMSQVLYCACNVCNAAVITDQSFLSVTVNNGRMLQVTGHM